MQTFLLGGFISLPTGDSNYFSLKIRALTNSLDEYAGGLLPVK
jgi:hypothetical protein